MRRLLGRGRRAALAVALLVVSGCFWQVPGARWNRSGHNDLETRITVDTVAGLVQAWEATVDEGPVGQPVTSTRGVHVDDGTDSVYSFDAATGAELWQYTYTDTSATHVYQPYVWDDRVLANRSSWDDMFDTLVELDAATGEPLSETELAHLAAVRGDTAVLVTTEWLDTGPGPIIAVDSLRVENLATGDAQSLGRFTTSLNGSDPDQYAVTLAGDWIVHSGWGVDMGGGRADGLRGYSISAPPASCDSPSTFVDVCPNWSTADGAGTPVLSADGSVVYDTSRAYETAMGDVLWERSTGTGGTPALAEDVLYVADDDGMLHAYSVDGRPQNGCPGGTCDPLWSGALGFAPDLSLQPAVAGGVVSVAGTGGELAAFDATGCASSSCAPLWTGSVGSQISGSPAVSNGRLYVGTADGRLVAFGLTPA